MKPGTTFVQEINREYLWALASLTARDMKEREQKHQADKRRKAWEARVEVSCRI